MSPGRTIEKVEPGARVELATCRWLRKLDVVDSKAFSCVVTHRFTRFLGPIVPFLFPTNSASSKSFACSRLLDKSFVGDFNCPVELAAFIRCGDTPRQF